VELLRKEEKNMEPTSVRYILDFQVIPKIFYQASAALMVAMDEQREEFFANLFNDFYKPANDTFLADDPKKFTKEDFTVKCYALSNKRPIFCVELPDEHFMSFVYCKAYLFAYDISEDNKGARVKFFTVEASDNGPTFLCSVDENGGRSNYGIVSDMHIHQIVATAAQIMYPNAFDGDDDNGNGVVNLKL
jgi:hypothetical protein